MLFSNMNVLLLDCTYMYVCMYVCMYVSMYVCMWILFQLWLSLQESLGTFVGQCGGLAFLQTLLDWNNFFVNVNIIPNVKTDCLYIY